MHSKDFSIGIIPAYIYGENQPLNPFSFNGQMDAYDWPQLLLLC